MFRFFNMIYFGKKSNSNLPKIISSSSSWQPLHFDMLPDFISQYGLFWGSDSTGFLGNTAQKMKFSIKDFFIFCAV